jgi:hypothetical protein
MFPNALCLQSVQSIMGATDTFLSKVSGLALSFNSGYLIIAGILLQIRNYTGSIGTPDSNQRCAASQKAQTSKPPGSIRADTPAIQRRKCWQPQKTTRTEVKHFASEISLHLLQ